MLALEKAIELVTKLDRTINYPKEFPGVVGLAKGLQKASDSLKIGASLIVDRCAGTSQFCPTDADLINVARDLARLDAVATGTYDSLAGSGNSVAADREDWKRQYGTPAPFEWRQIDAEKVKRVKDRERQMFSAIKAKYPGELSWGGMIAAARELGYADYADAWKQGMC